MASFSYDLHIHTCLSPCGDNDMTPANIIGMAALKELDIVAITDHNSSLNCRAAMDIGESMGITVIPGLELTTQEEIHAVCLFYDIDSALGFSDYVYKHLMKFPNDAKIFGHQHIVDVDDNITGEIPDLLINATDIGFSDIPRAIAPFNGVMIPAHVDKSSNSLLGNLGFVPPDSTFTTFECKNLTNLHRVRADHAYLRDCRVITDSDAHFLWDINEAVNFLELKDKSIASVLDTLKTRF